MPIRRALLATAAVYFALAGTVHAEDAWPSRPIKLVVPFAAGGTSDVLARALAEKLQGALKQTVIVDNKAGAGGVIGADSVAKAPADGYTILLGTIASHAINPALQPKMPYDALKDFAPVDLLGSISNVLLVGAGQPYKTVKDLTEDPYAGADLTLTLRAKDEAGNEGVSAPFEMRMPERLFVKPLARALIEQDSHSRDFQ